jgi:hypothetical protein
MLPAFSPLQWTLVLLSAVCIGLSKSGFPGVSMISVVVMAGLMPARQSTGVILPLLICGDMMAVRAFRDHVRWPYVWRTLPATVVGVAAGFGLLKLPLSERFFQILIGSVILVLVILQVARMTIASEKAMEKELPAGGPVALGMGMAAGVTTMVANAAGPVMSIYLISMRLPQYDFVGTMAVFFLLVNLIKVPFSVALGLIGPHSLMLNVVMLPGVAIGILGGRTILKRIPRKVFEWIILGLAAVAALKLVL